MVIWWCLVVIYPLVNKEFGVPNHQPDIIYQPWFSYVFLVVSYGFSYVFLVVLYGFLLGSTFKCGHHWHIHRSLHAERPSLLGWHVCPGTVADLVGYFEVTDKILAYIEIYYVYIYICICKCKYIYMYVCTYVCMHACMHVCMCIYMYMYMYM